AAGGRPEGPPAGHQPRPAALGLGAEGQPPRRAAPHPGLLHAQARRGGRAREEPLTGRAFPGDIRTQAFASSAPRERREPNGPGGRPTPWRRPPSPRPAAAPHPLPGPAPPPRALPPPAVTVRGPPPPPLRERP